MGVESKFYILPETSGYRPSAAKVAELVRLLRASGFLCDPSSPKFNLSAHDTGTFSSHPDYDGFHWRIRRTGGCGSLDDLEKRIDQNCESDILILWSTRDLVESGLKYPLSIIPGPEGVYYDIEFQLVADTVYHTSEIIEPFPEIKCICGAHLTEFDPTYDDPFFSLRLPNHCSVCQQQTNYATMPMTVRDGWTGDESTRLGGVTYRFCVIVDCGKYWPDESAEVSADFLAVIERCLEQSTRVFRDFY